MCSACAHGQKKEGHTVKSLNPFNLFLEITMPIIAWLLGVPISVVLLLMLFGVF